MRQGWRPIIVKGVGVGIVLALVAGCGKGGGGSGPSVDVNAPVISNLRLNFGTQGCTLANGSAGRLETVVVDYADADGNLRGGTYNDTTTPDVGVAITVTGAIPSAPIAITGTTSGTVSVLFCTRWNNATSIVEAVSVTDASGKTSNTLSAGANRPAGAPLLPGGAGEPGGFNKQGL